MRNGKQSRGVYLGTSRKIISLWCSLFRMSLILRFRPASCIGQKQLSYFKQAMLCSTASTNTASVSNLSGMTETAPSPPHSFLLLTSLSCTDIILPEAAQHPGRTGWAACLQYPQEHIALKSSKIAKSKQRRNIRYSTSPKQLSSIIKEGEKER